MGKVKGERRKGKGERGKASLRIKLRLTSEMGKASLRIKLRLTSEMGKAKGEMG